LVNSPKVGDPEIRNSTVIRKNTIINNQGDVEDFIQRVAVHRSTELHINRGQHRNNLPNPDQPFEIIQQDENEDYVSSQCEIE